MSWHELTPAYGRTYKSQKEVHEAWHSGKDFIHECLACDLGYGGKPLNKPQVPGHNFTVRYGKNNEKVTTVNG